MVAMRLLMGTRVVTVKIIVVAQRTADARIKPRLCGLDLCSKAAPRISAKAAAYQKGIHFPKELANCAEAWAWVWGASFVSWGWTKAATANSLPTMVAARAAATMS